MILALLFTFFTAQAPYIHDPAIGGVIDCTQYVILNSSRTGIVTEHTKCRLGPESDGKILEVFAFDAWGRLLPIKPPGK